MSLNFNLFGPHVIYLVGEIGAELMKSVQEQMIRVLAAQPEQIIVVVSTSGGRSDFTETLCDGFRLMREQFDVIIVGVGPVQSSGLDIFLSFPKEKRFLSLGAKLMTHQFQWHQILTLEGPVEACLMQLRELVQRAEYIMVDYETMLTQLAKETGRPVGMLREIINRGWEIPGQEALELGLCTAVF